MRDADTIKGEIIRIDRMHSSVNGNPRWEVTIVPGRGDHARIGESIKARTTPDSMLAYELDNFNVGDTVTATIGWHYGKLSLADLTRW